VRVLVTGAFGFIGTAVTHRFAQAGHEVVAVTHQPAGTALPPSPASDVIHADVRDKHAVHAAVSGVDAVCHLAALTQVRESFDNPAEYFEVNSAGTSNLLDALAATAARSGPPARFVQASTHAVYGAPEHQPITEDTALAPTSPYGRSKADAEAAVADAASRTGIGAVCLRVFNAAGAVAGRTDTDQTRLIPRTLSVATQRVAAMQVNGDGSAVRDFVHVDDVASAYLLALGACQPGSCAFYNVGATGASVREVIAAAEQITGRVIQVTHNPPKPEASVLIADTTQIRRELSWEPARSSLHQIIDDAWDVVRTRP
jgi:UDP-glucose 4-epimerase